MYHRVFSELSLLHHLCSCFFSIILLYCFSIILLYFFPFCLVILFVVCLCVIVLLCCLSEVGDHLCAVFCVED